MESTFPHSFHIPVMGLGYTIDTPVKVARFGITSVVSIIQDVLVEQMREFYSKLEGIEFIPVTSSELDHRARRITAYLNLLQDIIDKQIVKLKAEPFEEAKEIVKYFRILPEDSPAKKLYHEMLEATGNVKKSIQDKLREEIIAGCIDVNVMTKIDSPSFTSLGHALSYEFSDAASALRGFANSKLRSSIVFSAGLNPRLFSYLESFPDFFPDNEGNLSKRVILKVSDFRSAQVQGRYLAKKGIWISEFRVESGLNCGGHAFPTDGLLLGPILQEFLEKRDALESELYQTCTEVLVRKEKSCFTKKPKIRLSVQGGIGTHAEDEYLRKYYGVDSTGWGSPFLLVPEATNVDDETLQELLHSKREDYYVSHASPLGIPFNNFKRSSAERNRQLRISQKRPGSPCYLKYLAFNTEYTDKPICVSSREYQFKKIKEIQNSESLSGELKESLIAEVEEKDCLCEGLSASVLLRNNLPPHHNLRAVTICPGPNLSFFTGIFSLEEMIDHIYGRTSILNVQDRPNMFVNELKMYVDYFNEMVAKEVLPISEKRLKYLSEFRSNLIQGVEYYKSLFGKTQDNYPKELRNVDALCSAVSQLTSIELPQQKVEV